MSIESPFPVRTAVNHNIIHLLIKKNRGAMVAYLTTNLLLFRVYKPLHPPL